MNPADYHHWYETPRGRWIGGIEFELVRRMLGWKPGESILDVGCGTGYFTHRLAQSGAQLTGVDPNFEWIAFAADKGSSSENYAAGRAERLPFGDRSFDHSVSIAALCFMSDPRPGLAEMLRVTRQRFAVGLLNRRSTLYADKGRGGGQGAYRGACWHTPREVNAFFKTLPVDHLRILTAVFDARGGPLARAAEPLLPNALPFGAFIVATGHVV